MKRMMKLAPAAVIAVLIGCAETPLYPPKALLAPPAMHVGVPASACPLVALPPDARVLLCFNTTLIPGVWHGWILELSEAQPPAVSNGQAERTRLNHQYLLASPQGYTRWGPTDPLAPPGSLNENVHAFQAEFNGTLWFDVLRLHAAANAGSQDVPVVVFWLDAAGAAGELETTVETLLGAGVLNGGQANALTHKVDQALKLLGEGKDTAAVAVLQGFIQQVNDMTDDQVLTPAQAAALLMWAQYLIDAVFVQDLPISGPFAGTWSGTYTFGGMAGTLQQTGSAVSGTITDAVGCVWVVSGSASGNSLSLPSWQYQSGSAICVDAAVTMSGTLDASGTTITGTGSTTLAGGSPIPWTFALSRVGT